MSYASPPRRFAVASEDALREIHEREVGAKPSRVPLKGLGEAAGKKRKRVSSSVPFKQRAVFFFSCAVFPTGADQWRERSPPAEARALPVLCVE